MKILQLSNKVPYPEKDGGAIAINAVTEGLLKAGCEVRLLAMNTKKHFIEIGSIPEKFREERHLEAVFMDTSVKPLPAFVTLLRGKSYNIARFQSQAFSRRLTEILKQENPDIVHLEGLYLAPYTPLIRKHSKAPVIMRAHNIEWKIWKQLAEEEDIAWRKKYIEKLASQLKKYEENAINLFDGIATITQEDRAYLKKSNCIVPLVNIPLGIDISAYKIREPVFSNTLFHIGALDWLPNIQGMEWFLNTVWSKIHKALPQVQFHVAGRNMPTHFTNGKSPGVIFHGEVEDAKAFMNDYDIMLVPLLAGSGVRVKIIEGMAMGKPVITTSMGMNGIDCTYGQDAMVVDTPEQFLAAISRCIIDKELKQRLGQKGRAFIEEHHDNRKITERLISFYKERISEKP